MDESTGMYNMGKSGKIQPTLSFLQPLENGEKQQTVLFFPFEKKSLNLTPRNRKYGCKAESTWKGPVVDQCSLSKNNNLHGLSPK